MGLIWVINDEIQLDSKVTNVKEFLLQTPRGAYTTAQIKNSFEVVEWQLHIERLVKSIAALHATLNGFYTKYYNELQGSPENSNKDAEAELLKAAILPSLVLGLSTAANRFPESTERLTTLVLAPGLGPAPLDVHVAIAAAPGTPAGSGGACAAVLGPPRQVPIGKDSEWVAQRQFLESMRPEGAAEILLATRNGQILEGLVTNFYVITAAAAEDRGGGGGDEAPVVLQTAGMGDGVVWGTMRERVLQACKELGVKVVEEAPNAAQRSGWKEAFITNALRRVQPLGRVTCDPRNVCELESWEMEFSEAPGPWTAKIAVCVDASLQGVDVRTL